MEKYVGFDNSCTFLTVTTLECCDWTDTSSGFVQDDGPFLFRSTFMNTN